MSDKIPVQIDPKAFENLDTPLHTAIKTLPYSEENAQGGGLFEADPKAAPTVTVHRTPAQIAALRKALTDFVSAEPTFSASIKHCDPPTPDCF